MRRQRLAALFEVLAEGGGDDLDPVFGKFPQVALVQIPPDQVGAVDQAHPGLGAPQPVHELLRAFRIVPGGTEDGCVVDRPVPGLVPDGDLGVHSTDFQGVVEGPGVEVFLVLQGLLVGAYQRDSFHETPSSGAVRPPPDAIRWAPHTTAPPRFLRIDEP